MPAFAFVALLALGLMKAPPTEIAAGSPAPDFSLELLQGGEFSSDDLEGHPVVLNFWASWCVPCRDEVPALERAWREFRDDGLIIVGVNIRDASSDAERFVAEYDVTYPVIRDEELRLARKLGVVGVPETYFIDDEWKFVTTLAGARQGTEQGTVVLGPISEDALLDNIAVLLRRAGSPR
ncbi:MAG TPA: TlpA disulfide reductase family protein [Actinomycetota bacterium]|nr:TlpA disulfide reductase family protein [Actinomycetota bacterium]